MPSAVAHEERSVAPVSVRDVLAWAMRHGHPVAAAALRPVVEVAPMAERWTQETVSELVWSGLVRWCRSSGEPLPEGVPEALWVYLDYLDAMGRLDHSGVGLDHLRRPLRLWCGLDEGGRRRPAPGRTRRVARSATIVDFPHRFPSELTRAGR